MIRNFLIFNGYEVEIPPNIDEELYGEMIKRSHGSRTEETISVEEFKRRVDNDEYDLIKRSDGKEKSKEEKCNE